MNEHGESRTTTSLGSLAESAGSVDSFLAEVARISASSGVPPTPLLAPGAIIARRYEILRPVGRGAHGVVWAATDTLSRMEVAVKLLVATSAERAARVRAEVASLRRVRLPGVASLLDEGMEGDSVFLVMPLVRGAPFPGVPIPARWEALAPAAERLLETLAHVHAMGIVHRDLKPANVLVQAGDQPMLLDFGLSVAPSFGAVDERGRIVGTPAYLAPEQRSGQADARADLYAVGVMLYQALAGRLPHERTGVSALLAAKNEAAAPLSQLASHVPEHVARAVDSLLAVSPDSRPSSAIEALRRLRGERATGPARIELIGSERLGYDQIRALFPDTDRLSSACEDAARVLHERTGGDPAFVRREIEAWVRAGACRMDASVEPRLSIDRESVDRLEILHHARSWPVDPRAASEEALALALRLAATGRLGNAAAVLHEGLERLRGERAPDVSSIERVLSLWVQVAISDGTPHALDRVLYEMCRAGGGSARIAHLEALVRAALAVGAWTERALDLASAVPPFEDPALERHRCAVCVMAARRTSEEREEAVIGGLAAWADTSPDPAAHAAYSGWLGRLRYRQGRYDEAAELHEKAASGATWLAARAAALTARASALMEAFRLEEAAAVAEEAVTLSRSIRHVYGRALAEWTARVIAYRRAEPLRPDPGWIDDVALLHVRELEGLACMTEGAIALRTGDLDTARALSLRGVHVWSILGENAGGLLLVSALALACSPGPVAPEEVRALAEQALSCTTPGVGIQVLGLLAAHVDPEILSPARVGALAAQVPERHRETRVDILSVSEAMERLDARSGALTTRRSR